MNFPQKKHGLLIAIEGTDATGKKTQSLMLKDFIEKRIGPCELYSFPRYDTEIGQKIKHMLKDKEPWSIRKVNKIGMLFALDRNAASLEIKTHLENGTHVVCDRYTTSMLVYGAAMIMNLMKDSCVKLNLEEGQRGENPKIYLSDISKITAGEYVISQRHLEFEFLDVIMPSLEFRLLCPPETTKKRLLERHEADENSADSFELDEDLQKQVYQLYCNESEVSCYSTEKIEYIETEAFGLDLSIDSVFTNIVSRLKKYLGK